MTATYDGKLVIGKTRIEPCCASMHDALYAGAIYKGTADKVSCVSLRLGEKRGMPITRCPFCGAVPEQEAKK